MCIATNARETEAVARGPAEATKGRQAGMAGMAGRFFEVSITAGGRAEAERDRKEGSILVSEVS